MLFGNVFFYLLITFGSLRVRCKFVKQSFDGEIIQRSQCFLPFVLICCGLNLECVTSSLLIECDRYLSDPSNITGGCALSHDRHL